MARTADWPEALRRHAASIERLLQSDVALARPLVVGAVPVDGGNVVFGGELLDYLRGRAAAQDQARADRPQRGIEGRQAVMKPPARGCAGRADSLGLVVEDIDRHDRAARPKARQQGRIVGKAQIVTEPDD